MRSPLTLTPDAEIEDAVTGPEKSEGPETDKPAVTLTCAAVRVLKVAGNTKLALPAKLEEPDTFNVPAVTEARALVPATVRFPVIDTSLKLKEDTEREEIVTGPYKAVGPDTERPMSPMAAPSAISEPTVAPLTTVKEPAVTEVRALVPATVRSPESEMLSTLMEDTESDGILTGP
jgi:hypothetical protein